MRFLFRWRERTTSNERDLSYVSPWVLTRARRAQKRGVLGGKRGERGPRSTGVCNLGWRSNRTGERVHVYKETRGGKGKGQTLLLLAGSPFRGEKERLFSCKDEFRGGGKCFRLYFPWCEGGTGSSTALKIGTIIFGARPLSSPTHKKKRGGKRKSGDRSRRSRGGGEFSEYLDERREGERGGGGPSSTQSLRTERGGSVYHARPRGEKGSLTGFRGPY